MTAPNIFDQAARYAARELHGESFNRWVLPASVFRAWRQTGWLSTQLIAFPGEPDRRCDTVAVLERIAGDAPPVASVVEFQSRPRSDLPERLGEYLFRLRREVPYQREPRVSYDVVAVLVNLTGPPQPDVWVMAPPDFEGMGLMLRIRVVTLREVDAVELLGQIERGEVSRVVLAWLPLMKGADQPEVVQQWRVLALAEPDARIRAELGGLAKVFAELAERESVWAPVLETWNMEESKVVKEWIAQGYSKASLKGADALRNNLVKLLRKEFQELPADIAATLNSQTDLATLEVWFHRAIDATTIDDVRAAFRTP